jgi:hypothetical protein
MWSRKLDQVQGKNMTRMLVLVSLGVSLLLFNIPARGDEKKDEPPEPAVKKALAALREERFEDFAKAMHPDELKDLKKSLMAALTVAAKEGREKQFLRLMKAKSIDDLKDLSDVQFFASLTSNMFRLDMTIKQTFGAAEADLIGNVREGKNVAHVVCRVKMKIEGVPTTHMDVVSVKKTDDGWRLLLPSQVEVFASLVKQDLRGEK